LFVDLIKCRRFRFFGRLCRNYGGPLQMT